MKQVKSATTLRKRTPFALGQGDAFGVKRVARSLLPTIVAGSCTLQSTGGHPDCPHWAAHAIGTGESLVHLEAAASGFSSAAVSDAVLRGAAAAAADALVDIELDLERVETAARISRERALPYGLPGAASLEPGMAPKAATRPASRALNMQATATPAAQALDYHAQEPGGGFLSDSDWDDDAADALCAQPFALQHGRVHQAAATAGHAEAITTSSGHHGCAVSAAVQPSTTTCATHISPQAATPHSQAQLPIHVELPVSSDAAGADLQCAIEFDDDAQAPLKPLWQTLPVLHQQAVQHARTAAPSQGVSSAPICIADDTAGFAADGLLQHQPALLPRALAAGAQELTEHDLAAIIGADSSALCDIVFGDEAVDAEPCPSPPAASSAPSRSDAGDVESVEVHRQAPTVHTAAVMPAVAEESAAWQKIAMCFDDGSDHVDAAGWTGSSQPRSPIGTPPGVSVTCLTHAGAGQSPVGTVEPTKLSPASLAPHTDVAEPLAAEMQKVSTRRTRPVIKATILKV